MGAETMFLRALQGYEEALGQEHTSTVQTVNNLGLLYADQSKLKEGGPFSTTLAKDQLAYSFRANW